MKFWIDKLVKDVLNEMPGLEIVEIKKSPEKYARDFIVEYAVLENPLGRRIVISHEWERGKEHNVNVTVSWYDLDRDVSISLNSTADPEIIGSTVIALLILAGKISLCLAKKEVKADV